MLTAVQKVNITIKKT